VSPASFDIASAAAAARSATSSLPSSSADPTSLDVFTKWKTNPKEVERQFAST
jgi:hypothetical protein